MVKFSLFHSYEVNKFHLCKAQFQKHNDTPHTHTLLSVHITYPPSSFIHSFFPRPLSFNNDTFQFSSQSQAQHQIREEKKEERKKTLSLKGQIKAVNNSKFSNCQFTPICYILCTLHVGYHRLGETGYLPHFAKLITLSIMIPSACILFQNIGFLQVFFFAKQLHVCMCVYIHMFIKGF